MVEHSWAGDERVTAYALFSRRPRDRQLSHAVLAVAGMLVGGAVAQAADPAELEFDLPAQPLSAALETYSAATGVVVLYNGALAVGRTSADVKGLLSPEDALRLLLKDTGLAAQYTAQDAVVVMPAERDPATAWRPLDIAQAALSQSNSSERRYYGLVQAHVRDVLCGSALTRPGGYRLALQLWIGPSGTVTHSHPLSSTGDSKRDAAVLSGLEQASIIEPPPPHMAQPFTMVALPAASGGVVHCPNPALKDRRNG